MMRPDRSRLYAWCYKCEKDEPTRSITRWPKHAPLDAVMHCGWCGMRLYNLLQVRNPHQWREDCRTWQPDTAI